MADNLGSLYGAVSQKFDIGSEADFRAKMQTTEDRKKFYDAVSGKGFDLGDYNAYETRLGEVKKKEPTESTTSVSAEPVSQDTKPSEQVGTDNVLELPKSYQYNRNNKSELQVGKAYQTTPREIKRWTGDHFEKNPDASPLKSLVDFSVKGIKGIAPEAMEKLDSLPSGIGDKKANIAEAYRQTSKVQDEAAGLAMQNKLLTSFAPVQQLNQLNEEYALAPEDKKVEIQKKIDELANRPITNSDFVGTRFSKGDLNVSQNFTPTVKAGQKLEEYDGEEPSNVVPEKIKTVGDAYAKAKQNEEFIKDAQAESFTLNSITKTEQQKLLSPDQIAMIDAIPDPQAREDEFQKQLDLSKTDAAVSTSFLRGMNNTMEGLFNVGKYAGMEPKELNAEMERDYYKQQLFSVQPEGLAAKTAEGIGGMVPDMALSLVGGTPAMLASMSARHPQEALKQYYFDKFSKGETPDYNEAWKFATISTAINTSIFGGASLVGGGAMPISGTVKQAALDFLTGTVKNAAKDAAIFGLGGKAIQDLNSNAFDVEHDNNYIQAGIEMGVFGGVMYGLTHAPAIIRSKWSQAKINKAIDVSSFMPPDVTAKMIQDGQENGFITPQEATEIELRQARVRQIVNQFPKELTIEQIQEIEPLWAEKDRLSSQMKEASPVMKKILAGKISELDEKALIKGAVPLTAEEKAEYKDLITAEATEGGKTDKSRLTYLRKRMEAASTEKQSKKEADAKESSKGGDGEDAKPEAETGAENLAEGGKEEVVAEVVEPKIEGTDLTNSEAIKFLDDHVVDGPIQKLELHPDFELNSEELERGIRQIRKGEFDKAGAKKVLAKIDEWKRQGYVDYMRGAGKQIQKTSLPFDMTEALAQLPKEQAEAVIQAENELEANTGIDEALKNFTDKDGNLDLAKLSEELKNAKEPNYWGDLLGLNEEELTNLQNIIDNEQSKKATDSASPKSENQNDAKPESNIGKEIAFKHAGQTVKGKIESIDENGNYKVKIKGINYTVKPKDAKIAVKEVVDKSGRDFINEGWNEIKDALNNPTGTLTLNPKLVTGFAKIGYGLIKEGNATVKNVIDKIKDYIKANGGWSNITEKDFNESVKDIKAKIDELNQKSFLETVKDSPATSKEMAEKTAELDQFYETLHNKEALAAADKKIAEDLGKAKDFVMSDAAPSAEKSAMAVRLIKHFESVKDFDSAIEVLNAYDNQLRESGRFIQAASLWNRLDPNTIVRAANKEAKKLGQDLSPEVQKEILRRMTEVQKLPEGTERDKGTLEVLNYIADQLPLSAMDWLDAYRYQNMLSNPRSHERNIWGNLLNVFATEPASLAMKSGFDLFSNIQNPAARDAKFSQIPTYYKDALMNIPNAFIAAKETFRNGYVADKILDIGNTTSQIEALRRTKLPKYLTVVTRFLESQDRFFSVLIGQGEKMRLMRNGVGEADATARATKLAEEYLYREKLDASDKSKPYFVGALDGLGQGINYLRKIPRIGKGLSWFVPFVTTPINVAKMGVKFSPLGFVGGKDMYSSPNAKTTIANATLGSIMTGVGATMAIQGLTSWAAPKDKKERELFYASGRKPYSVKIGDKWVPMAYFGPFGLSLALPASVKHFQEDTKTALTDGEIEQVKDAILSTSGFITSQTPLSSVDGFFKTIGGDDDYTIDKVTGYVTSQAIPLVGLVRYINTILDPVYRKSKGYLESIESGIPELSKELDPIKTPDGKVAEREPSNALLPYDLGFSDTDYDIMLKVRRERNKRKELKKAKAAEKKKH